MGKAEVPLNFLIKLIEDGTRYQILSEYVDNGKDFINDDVVRTILGIKKNEKVEKKDVQIMQTRTM